MNELRSDLDRLGRDKVDCSALESYTARVSALVEQLAAGLGGDTRSLADTVGQQLARLRAELAEVAGRLRGEVGELGAAVQSKADKAGVARLEAGLQQLGEEQRATAGAAR